MLGQHCNRKHKMSIHLDTKEKIDKKADFLDEIRISLIERIHHLFSFFGIRQEEIPLFLKNFKISLKDVLHERDLLEKFNENVISYISNKFLINEKWIYRKADEMIPIRSREFYKNSGCFCEKIYKSNPNHIFILSERKPNKKIDEERDDNRFAIIIEYVVSKIGKEDILAYAIYDDAECRYGYWRCRYELKRFLLGFKKKTFIPSAYGYSIPNIAKQLREFSKGKKRWPDVIKNKTIWYPEDYIDYPSENMNAVKEELDELKRVVEEYNNTSNY